jgi:hypothetical protein
MARSKKVREHPSMEARRERALEMMLAGAFDTTIAKELGVDRRTIYRWREDPEFAEELEERRLEIRDAFYARLLGMAGAAMDALESQMRGFFLDDAGQAVQVKADMARVKAIDTWAGLLGVHKNAPAAPVRRGSELEDEDDLGELLDKVPETELEAALARKRAAAEARRKLIKSVPKPKGDATKRRKPRPVGEEG